MAATDAPLSENKQMQISNKVDIQQYVDMAQKYKWHGIIPATALILTLFTLSFFLPKIYKSSCLIEVDRGAIENPLKEQRERMQNMTDQLNVFAQNAVKWSILSQVVDKVGADVILENSDKYNLKALTGGFSSNGSKKLSVQEEYFRKEAVISLLKKEIQFNQKPPKFMVIEYTGVLPKANAAILNTLVSTLIEEKEKNQLAQAGQNYEFIRAEMETYKQKLEKAEVTLKEFKEQHVSELPSNMTMHLTSLSTDKSELMASELELKELTDRVSYIDKQMKKQDELLVGETNDVTNPMLAGLNKKIVDLEIDLTSLGSNYTDLHPRVVELKAQLRDLKKQRENVKSSTLEKENLMLNPIYKQLAQERQNSILRADMLRDRVRQLKDRIRENERMVQSMPSQEQQLLTLTRNYEVTANIYNMFLQKLEEARLNEKLISEATDKDAFRVLEYARVPLSPIGPARLKLLLIILLLGAGLGGGIVASLNYLDDSLNSVDETKAFLGKPLLGIVPSLTARNGDAAFHKRLPRKTEKPLPKTMA
jgi:polysaccharide chain length determinant protein (PEP-CTERM system associated)